MACGNRLVSAYFISQNGNKEKYTYQSVCQSRFIRYKWCNYKGCNRCKQCVGWHKVGYFCYLGGFNTVFLISENPKQNRYCCNCAGLHNPKHTRLTVGNKKVHKVHTCITGEQNTGRTPHQCGSTLQVWWNRHGKHRVYRGNIKFFGYCQGNRRYHKHSGNIVYKGGNKTRK